VTTRHYYAYCDDCGAQSELYARWPVCRDCDRDICPSCYSPGSYVDQDYSDDGEGGCWAMGHDCLCRECADDGSDRAGGVVEDEKGDDRS
jgi:hypothetical protein